MCEAAKNVSSCWHQNEHTLQLPLWPTAAAPAASSASAVQGAVNTDKLYSAYHYSHPPLVERLAAIDAGMKKAS